MIGFLRFVGLMNAAVWFGAAIFFTFGVGAAPFSPEMKELLRPLGPLNSPYFPGAIAQILVKRYFHLQLACGVVALLHVLAEWIYFGRTPPKRWLGLLIALIMAGLVGGYWMQPKMKELHKIKYGVGVKSSQAERDAADHSFRAWHGAAQGMNLLMLAGLGLYLWRVANPDDPARFVSTTKFRG